MLRDDFSVQRLVEVFADPEIARQLAVQIDVLAVADHQHADVGFDHLGQRSQGGHRLFVAADIDHQDPRGRQFGHGGDGAAAVATLHHDVFLGRGDEAQAQHGLGFGVGDEGQHLGAAAAAGGGLRGGLGDRCGGVGHQGAAAAAPGADCTCRSLMALSGSGFT